MFMVGGVGDFGGVVVADFGSERGDEHERIFDVVVDDVAIDFDAVDAVIDEASCRSRRAVRRSEDS